MEGTGPQRDFAQGQQDTGAELERFPDSGFER